ncbi:MAG: hypothetical protein ACRD2U_04365 [Terriglobales bacterium]
MSNDKKRGQSGEAKGRLDKFKSDDDLRPIEDRNQYEQRINSLPPEQKELAQQSTRLADLCQYFSRQSMDIPPRVLEQVGRLSTLAIAERIRAMKDINQTLMEYLNDVGQDPGIRQ